MIFDADLMTAISTIGFPIVACLIMYIDFRKVITRNTEAVLKLITIFESKRFK